jgi:hypothetical protein
MSGDQTTVFSSADKRFLMYGQENALTERKDRDGKVTLIVDNP